VQTGHSKLTPSDEFTHFMHTYQNMVFSTAARMSGSPAQAEDIAQEVFLKAFQSFAQLRDSASAPGWLKIVTRRTTLNYLTRYRRRWRFFSELDGEAPHESDFQSDLPAPDTLLTDLDAPRRQALIEQAIRELPEAQRVPMVLFHFEDMPYLEIARFLGVSLPKVKTDIQRGRAALLAKLTARGVESQHPESSP